MRKKRYKVVSGEVCDFQTLEKMRAYLEELSEVDDAGELLQRKANLTRRLKSANEVTASLAKASGKFEGTPGDQEV